MNSGIYQIRNIQNDKIYIGSTKNFNNRKLRHFRDLENQSHHSISLQRAYNKYGKENFIFEILEECDFENVLKLEQQYLDIFKPFDCIGYNISKKATNAVLFGEKNGMFGKIGANKDKKFSQSIKDKISIGNKGKKRSAEVCEGMSIRAKLRVGIKSSMYGKKISDKQKNILSISHSIKVVQYDRFNGNLIKIWDSGKMASETLNLSATSIAACCQKKLNTAGDFIWRKFDSIYSYNTNIFEIEKDLKLDERNKTIYQYDLNKDYIQMWRSSACIKEQLGFVPKTITACCNKNKDNLNHYSNGFIWSYSKI